MWRAGFRPEKTPAAGCRITNIEGLDSKVYNKIGR